MVRPLRPARVLLLALFPLLALLGAVPPPKQQALVLDAADDSYVTTDASATGDPRGLRDSNYGVQDSVRVGYQWKVQGDEQVVAVGLVRFELARLKDMNVNSAQLQLFSTATDLSQPRLVDADVAEGAWSEKTVTFTKKPSWGSNAVATAVVYGPGVWTAWDVTPSVQQKAQSGTVSYALGMRTLAEKQAEQVLFGSKEAGQNGPRLIVTYTSGPLIIPWYIWAGGTVVAAVAAFIAGLSVARRGARAAFGRVAS